MFYRRMLMVALPLSVLAASLSKDLSAAATSTASVSTWANSTTREFKKVKSKDRNSSAATFATNVMNVLKASGLQSGGTVFSGFSAIIQDALTQLKTDLKTIQSKSNVTQDLIDQLVKDLKDAAATGTPPSVDSVQVLLTDAQSALADGVISEKEKLQLASAVSDVIASTGLTADQFAAVQNDVLAIIAASGVTAADIELIKSDLETIVALAKAERI